MSDAQSPERSEAIVEVELRLTDGECPLVELPRAEDCRLVLEQLLPRDDGAYAQYFSVIGTAADRVLELAADIDHLDSRLLVPYESGGLFEFLVTSHCPVCTLARRGAVPTSVTGTAEGATIVAEIFPGDDPSEIISAVLEEYAVELAAKRRKADATPLLSERELRETVLDRLTERQREVLFAAFEAGYYERPRRTTGTELADELGITSTTFQQHIRAAERKLVSFVAERRTE